MKTKDKEIKVISHNKPSVERLDEMIEEINEKLSILYSTGIDERSKKNGNIRNEKSD